MITWRMILNYLYEIEGSCRVKYVIEKFGVSKQRVSKTLKLLYSWDYLRYTNSRFKGRGGYEVTDAGRRLVEKWKEEGVDISQGPGFHQRCRECTFKNWRERSNQKEGDINET